VYQPGAKSADFKSLGVRHAENVPAAFFRPYHPGDLSRRAKLKRPAGSGLADFFIFVILFQALGYAARKAGLYYTYPCVPNLTLAGATFYRGLRMDRHTKREKLFEYKWEFLRRNKGYCQDWEQLKPLIEAQWARLHPLWELLPEELAFCKKWKLSRPLDPALSYDERLMRDPIIPDVLDTDTGKKGPKRLSEILLGWEKEQRRRDLHADLTPLEDVPARVVANEMGIFDCDMERGTVRVEINLRHPEKRLLRELRLIIKEWHQHHLKAQRQVTRPAPRSTKMPSIEKLEKYLEVYDRRHKDKPDSWGRIARALNLTNDGATKIYKAACKWIKEGIPLYNR
jgi:hypothetical protein